MKNNSYDYLLKLIGVGLFVYFIFKVDFSSLAKILYNVNIYFFVLALSLFFFMLYFKTLKWHIVLKSLNIDLPFVTALRYQVAGNYFSGLMPGRIGDAVRIFYLRDNNVTFARSILSILMEKFFELVVALGFATIGVVQFVHNKQFLILFLSFSTTIFFLIVLFVIFPSSFIAITQKIISNSKFHFLLKLNIFFDELKSLNTRFYLKLILISTITMFLYYIQVLLLSYALDLSLSIFTMFGLVGFALISSLVPITYMGIGFRDGAYIYCFAELGRTDEMAIALSLLILGLHLINQVILFILFIVVKKDSKRTTFT
jgi:glycosyltransferase 2 family protein